VQLEDKQLRRSPQLLVWSNSRSETSCILIS